MRSVTKFIYVLGEMEGWFNDNYSTSSLVLQIREKLRRFWSKLGYGLVKLGLATRMFSNGRKIIHRETSNKLATPTKQITMQKIIWMMSLLVVSDPNVVYCTYNLSEYGKLEWCNSMCLFKGYINGRWLWSQRV